MKGYLKMPKKTLLIDDSKELLSFYELNLEVWTGLEVIKARSLSDAANTLAQNPDIDLVITRARIKLEKTAEKVLALLEKLPNSAKLIVLGRSTLEKQDILHIPSGLEVKTLIQAVAQSLGITAKDMATLVVPEYYPIKSHYFQHITSCGADVYKQNLDDFELIVKEQEELDLKLINDLIYDGVKEFFVKKNDRLKFTYQLTSELVVSIGDEHLSEDEQISSAEMSTQLVQKKMNRLGITEDTVRLANKSIKQMSNTAKKYPRLGHLLKRMMSNKSGYLYKHTQVLIYVCSHIMDYIDWGNDEQKDKISFVAFFHDIALETDEQAMISSQSELDNSNLSNAQKDLVLKHAQVSAELVVKFPHAPMGADVIIRQHHGIPHGIGFSETYAANLSPMTIVFILCQDFVHQLLKSGDNFNLEAKIQQMRERYPTQRFKRIIDILEEISI